jgi:hypothetical protein
VRIGERVTALTPGNVGCGGTSEATGLGKSGIKRAAIVPGAGRANGPAGKAASSEASFHVAAAGGNRANEAASSQGSTSSRASAESTVSCIPLLSSQIGASRKSSNSEPSENTEPVRFMSITECLSVTVKRLPAAPRQGFGPPQAGVQEAKPVPDATSSRLRHFGRWRLPLGQTCAEKRIHTLRARYTMIRTSRTVPRMPPPIYI